MLQDNYLNIETLFGNQKIQLIIAGDESSPVFTPDDALENGEAEFQIQEGCLYEYSLTKGFLLEKDEIVKPSKLNASKGTISPNIYVGTITLHVTDDLHNPVSKIKLEVRSHKTRYREDYRRMLGFITEKCTELLLQHNSPVSQLLEVNFNADSKVMYQRFAFVKSVLEAPEFADALNKIISSPVTNWKDTEVLKDIRNARRLDNRVLRQIAACGNRIKVPEGHPLRISLKSIPVKIQVAAKTETVDTPENRFIKFALNSFLSFVSEFVSRINVENRIKSEARLLENFIDDYLSHSIFKEISNPDTLPLNSPVLQRKEGYREVLRVWLMFDLAASLIWHGGDDVYDGEKKDVAVLYEYWLFFKLLDILKDLYKIEPEQLDQLISETKDGLGLQLKQGKHIPLKGVYTGNNRKLNVQFSYNRVFSGKQEYPASGSWSVAMRPDYTLSIWPYAIDDVKAEAEELIVHIHFDAKYRIDNLNALFSDTLEPYVILDDLQKELSNEKTEQIRGNVKRADLLKMHAYKDAIRRTSGAYVLYPGSETEKRIGFHEIIPGLGAFAIKPLDGGLDGSEELKFFLKEVTEHYMNRSSEREIISLKTYTTYNSNPYSIKDVLPENYGRNRLLLPTETTVLVGYYKSAEHLEWIVSNQLYNTRTGNTKGSLRFSNKETGARYLLLYGPVETVTNKLFKLSDEGPRIYSKADMQLKGYHDPKHDFYLLFDIINEAEAEFNSYKWDVSKLPGYLTGDDFGSPFAVSIVDLMSKGKVS